MSQFKKEFKLYDAVMLVSGSMIGSGIFIVSSDVARQVGSAGWLLVAWLITGLLTLAGAISYGELTAMFPEAGGQYVYLQKAYGRLVGFLYGWSFFAVIQTGTIAAVAVAFAKYTGVLFPNFINDDTLISIFGNVKVSSQRLLAIFSIVLLTYTNSRGAKEGKIVQNIFSTTKLIAMGLIILLGALIGSSAEVIDLNFTNMWAAEGLTKNTDGSYSLAVLGSLGIIMALGVSQVGTLFSSDAWNSLTFAGDEVVEPEKTIPRGLAIGTLLVTALYILLNIIYLVVLPLKGSPTGETAFARGIQFATNDRVGAAVAEQIGGASFSIVMAILIMISTFGCNNGLILSGARVYYKMAKDGLFFKGFGTLSDAGVPKTSLWWQCLWASVLCLTGVYGDLLDYFMGVVILFYAITILGIFVLRRTMPDARRVVKAPWFPWLQIGYIVVSLTLVLILIIRKPEYTYPGLLIVAAGVPLYYFFKNRS